MVAVRERLCPRCGVGRVYLTYERDLACMCGWRGYPNGPLMPVRVVNTQTHKQCSRCGETKPASEFSPHGERLASWCKPCSAAVKRERLAKIKAAETEAQEPVKPVKRCARCERDLPLSAYNARFGRPGGVQSWCRECTNAAARERRALSGKGVK